MWIKQLPEDYSTKSSSCYREVFLWQSGNVFVMDNHKSALWCWLQSCNPRKSYNFMHIDRHYDLLDNLTNEEIGLLKTNPHIGFNDFSSLKKQDGKFKVFRWDNYNICGLFASSTMVSYKYFTYS